LSAIAAGDSGRVAETAETKAVGVPLRTIESATRSRVTRGQDALNRIAFLRAKTSNAGFETSDLFVRVIIISPPDLPAGSNEPERVG
jgi:hypothetical protein